MFRQKLFLVLVVSLGTSTLTGNEAQADDCWHGVEWFDAPRNEIRQCLHADMQAYREGIEVYPFEWWSAGSGSSGTVSMYHWLYEGDYLGVFHLRYNLAQHGFSSSLDAAPLGTTFSSVSFTFQATEKTSLYMGIIHDEAVSNVAAQAHSWLDRATLDFALSDEVTLTEPFDSKAFFLSLFPSRDAPSASLLGFRADVNGIAPVPLPPALPLLLGGLAGLGWLARRTGTRIAVS